MRRATWGLVAAVLASTASLRAQEGPFPDIKVATVPAVWQYSNDGGKTFRDTPHSGPTFGTRTSNYPYAWKGTFEIADPAKVAGLWVREVDERGDKSRGSICNDGIDWASGGYWKDLGFCPALLSATITLNGKEVKLAGGTGPILYFWAPLEGQLVKGVNTIEVHANVYTYWGGGQFAGAEAIARQICLRLAAAEPQPAKIYNGPVLGDFGDGYFTLACRTQLTADLTVEATPLEPVGPAVKVVSAGRIWHRVKVEVPKGTRKVRYSLTARVGEHETKCGPFDVAFPGAQYRFVAFGNVSGHSSSIELWQDNFREALGANPAFLVNTGNPMEQGTWEFVWDEYFVKPTGDGLARVPSLVTPCCRDYSGVFNQLFYTPAPGGLGHNWSKVIGPVRFIGLDGNETWTPKADCYAWLEKELAAAKEKFVIVLEGYPGYSSGANSGKRNPNLNQARDVILPLLGKYKATMMLCSWDPDYERCEPTPDKGVVQIVTGAIAKASMHRWSNVIATNPFGGGPESGSRTSGGLAKFKDGRQWCGWVGLRHYCTFDVTSDSIVMNVWATLKGGWCAGRDLGFGKPSLMDTKVFKPRN